MSDYEDYEEWGQEEEAEEDFREHQFQVRQKQKQFNSAVAAEVRRQLAKVQNLPPAIAKDHGVTQVKAKPVSSGATQEVNCKCCGKPFIARVADLKRGWGKFCSKSCKAKKQESETGHFVRFLAAQI